MAEKSAEANAFKLARAKSNATSRTIKLILFVQGGFALVMATVMTVILTFLFHLNAPLAFLGSLVGTFAISLSRTSVKTIWQSNFASCCQEEGLWEKAEELATLGISKEIEQILSGKQPQTSGHELPMKVSQLQVMAIRRGDLKTAVKYSEYLYRNSVDDRHNRAYQANSLACNYMELGNFSRGFELFGSNLDELDASGRSDTPAYISTLLGMVQACIDLERTEEAEKYLARLQKSIEASRDSSSSNKTDSWIKQTVSTGGVDDAFALYFAARIKMLKNSPEAELQLLQAFEIVKDPDIQKRLTLLLPEMLTVHAQLMVSKNNYDKAEKLAQQALDYYESKTQNKGADYVKARRTLAHARLLKGENTTAELEECLRLMQDLVFEPHPSIALSLFQVGQAYAKENDPDKAREFLRRSLDMRTRLLPEGSPSIRETEALLAKLPAEVKLEVITEKQTEP
jgi:tetratricopeptide (TPR) repeat protein